jgi:putative cardiolipin synthase
MKTTLTCLSLRLALLATALFTVGCGTLPKSPTKNTTLALPPAREGVLHHTRAQLAATTEPGQSSFLLLHDNRAALQWRLALIDEATTSIDLKVFIWQNDLTGRLLFDRLVEASQRGVRVRLMVDDFALSGSDTSLAAIAALDNVDMRIFNPSSVRRGIIGPLMEMVLYFKELNVRMHNKLMVVDGHWSVVGGRNIGNCYFGADKKYNFRDLDALVTGPIAKDLATAFDDYWNSEPAYPAAAMGNVTPKKLEKYLKSREKRREKDLKVLKTTDYAYHRRDWSEAFSQLPNQMLPGIARYFHEDPVIDSNKDDFLLAGLEKVLRDAKESVTLVTPYMIPPRALMRGLEAAQKKGTEVNLLTASLAANNHTIAHSHYKKYRKKLLKTGVNLSEYKDQPSPEQRELCDAKPYRADFIALHVKAAAVDHRYLYIGSLNLDPRALKINTEDVMYIDSPSLTQQFEASVVQMTADESAWKLYRNQHGFLRWKADGKKRRTQPARGLFQRVTDFFCRWIPIERQI